MEGVSSPLHQSCRVRLSFRHVITLLPMPKRAWRAGKGNEKKAADRFAQRAAFVALSAQCGGAESKDCLAAYVYTCWCSAWLFCRSLRVRVYVQHTYASVRVCLCWWKEKGGGSEVENRKIWTTWAWVRAALQYISVSFSRQACSMFYSGFLFVFCHRRLLTTVFEETF